MQLLSTCIKIIINDYTSKVETNPWSKHIGVGAKGGLGGHVPMFSSASLFLCVQSQGGNFYGKMGTTSNIKFLLNSNQFSLSSFLRILYCTPFYSNKKSSIPWSKMGVTKGCDP